MENCTKTNYIFSNVWTCLLQKFYVVYDKQY